MIGHGLRGVTSNVLHEDEHIELQLAEKRNKVAAR